MARYKERSQENVLVPINLGQQLIPGSFEFTLTGRAKKLTAACEFPHNAFLRGSS